MSKPVIPIEHFPKVLAAARQGDLEALGELLEASRSYLLFVANERLPRVLSAKMGGSDLVQETFLDVQKCFGQFHGSTEVELLAWLRRGLVYRLANGLRAFKATAKRNVGREISLTCSTQESRQARQIVRGMAMAEASPAEQEKALAMRLGLQLLSDEQRTVVVLRFSDKMSWEEIGDELGISSEAARKLCTRALIRVGTIAKTIQLQDLDEGQETSG
jgi:RNA polymerase sigma-70 factor, ECF subfamily